MALKQRKGFEVGFEDIKDQIKTALTAVPRGITGDLPGAIRESLAMQLRSFRRQMELAPVKIQEKLASLASGLKKAANYIKPTSPYEGPPLPQALGLKWPKLK